MKVRTITIRVPENEIKVLEEYCVETGRSKTDVLREFIRKLGRNYNN